MIKKAPTGFFLLERLSHDKVRRIGILPPSPPNMEPQHYRELSEGAKALLEANTETAEWRGRRYRFSVPSLAAYPFQWFWDSCFHAIVWTRLGEIERAKDELRGFFVFQEPNGFIPHVIFWNQKRVRRSPFYWHYLESCGRLSFLPWTKKPLATAHIQPPLLAQAVERIVLASGDERFLNEALPVLERYYRWLSSGRDPDHDGLISIIAQYESGLDFSPAYDAALGLRPPRFRGLGVKPRIPEGLNVLLGQHLPTIFRLSPWHIEDVLVNSIYIQGLQALGRLARRLEHANVSRETSQRGHATAVAEWAEAQAARVLRTLVAKCFDASAGLFWNLTGAQERQSKVKTIISLTPLIVPDLPRPIVEQLVAHLVDPKEFWTRYPLPSVAINESSFTPDNRVCGHRRIWRGPLSMNTNWFLAHGLRQHGYTDLADHIGQTSRELVVQHGFNEFFDPHTGVPVGANRFGWATLVIDLP